VALTIGSLFTGIAGLDVGVLAAFVEAGIPARVAWQCEIDPFCARVLAKHFPHVTRFSDVATVNRPPTVDVLVGGFMCTDVSAAGKGAGLGEETRSGNTWKHYKRIIGEVEPRAVIVENVTSGAKRWLPQVVRELRSLGYRPHAVPVGAIHVGAPHRRLRVFVVALRELAGLEERGKQPAREERAAAQRGCQTGGDEALAHGHGHGREGERRGRLLDREREALGDDADGCGGASISDAERGDVRERSGRLGGASGAGAGEPDRDGEGVGNTASGRRHPGRVDEPWERDERRAPAGICAAVPGGDGRPAESGVGAGADGLPFDVAGHRWPAGRGEAQHEWEPPRAVSREVSVPERPAKLRSCGNAVVPQCGLVAGRVLVMLMMNAGYRFQCE
jgi:DNA (cytosine-5)-methyltransferase 1